MIMSILDEIKDEEVWNRFLQEKRMKSQLTAREEKELTVFIREKQYLPLAETPAFDYPAKKEIAKSGSEKKRTVYMYGKEETWILKLIAWLLYRYDSRMPSRCYAFRKGRTAKSALRDIRALENPDACWTVKADIRNYFNSIDPQLLSEKLKDFLSDDPRLYEFLNALLLQNKCYENGVLKEEMRGAMAGMPLSSFFANLYLMDLDLLFEAKRIPCFRYSDDILLFASCEEEASSHLSLLEDELRKRHLSLNPEKTGLSAPHEAWEFLGFRYQDGEVDLSKNTIRKMKAKIRRKARRLYAWRKKTGSDYDRAAKAMIRSMDRVFYDLFGTNQFTWTRFYFPLITVSTGLHEIDEYCLMYLRYLYSGRHTKGNYRISYERVKRLGYTPLVAEYYRWKEENRKLKAQ